MKSFPLPALVAAFAAVAALPFSLAAAGTLLFTAALGLVIYADYAQRCQRIRLPKRAIQPDSSSTRSTFQGETHPLAA